MQIDPRYDDVVAEVAEFLGDRVRVALDAGIAAERICVDPGIGFGKTLEHNTRLLRELGSLAELGYPVLVGVSRKRFLGAITGRGESERLAGTVGANVVALERGASIFRVHDVGPNRDALDVAAAIVRAG
jgi:dihydropteroate synthase